MTLCSLRLCFGQGGNWKGDQVSGRGSQLYGDHADAPLVDPTYQRSFKRVGVGSWKELVNEP